MSYKKQRLSPTGLGRGSYHGIDRERRSLDCQEEIRSFFLVGRWGISLRLSRIFRTKWPYEEASFSSIVFAGENVQFLLNQHRLDWFRLRLTEINRLSIHQLAKPPLSSEAED